MTSAYCASKFAIRGLTQSAGMLIHRLIASHKRGVDTIKPANTGVTGLR
jgi:NAD(P)-dependent dehydrogenase (short-subunit alcohol dehydrogenase family)